MTLHVKIEAPKENGAPSDNDSLFSRSTLTGLSLPQKMIESKWFYDRAGSELFDQITELDEYYPTRTETLILKERAEDIASLVPSNGLFLEFGSGSSTKTRLVLDALAADVSYVPVDISEEHLLASAEQLCTDYPGLHVTPVVGDFTADILVPDALEDKQKVLFFPGSTLGNFSEEDAQAFLKRCRTMPKVSSFVIGVDLVKDEETLVRAYDDEKGVTAAFNLNLLTRINRELGADFNLSSFRHEARWNAEKNRIEMYLVSECDQAVDILDQTISFQAGEDIHTENSHKYTKASVAELAQASGWSLGEFWTDPDDLFGVFVLR